MCLDNYNDEIKQKGTIKSYDTLFAVEGPNYDDFFCKHCPPSTNGNGNDRLGGKDTYNQSGDLQIVPRLVVFKQPLRCPS